MPRGNYFEFLKEEAAGSGLERKTVQRDATSIGPAGNDRGGR